MVASPWSEFTAILGAHACENTCVLMFRSTPKDCGGLLETNLAGASPYYCHGNQRKGGKSHQVSAVLAREWSGGVWAFPSDHHRPASVLRLHC